MIIAIDDELEAAYFLKENYVEFNKVATINNAEELLDNQIENIYRSNLPEFENIYKMLINWRQEIVNSFNLVKNKERINNSIIESRNSIIKKIIRNSNGVKNFHRLKLRIMYCINKQSYNIVEHKNIIKQKGKPRGKYNKNKKEK